MGSPYAHMSTRWVLIPDPVGGPVTLRFSFSSRTVSLRLPGSLTTPKGGTGPLRGPVTLRLMSAHACTCTCA